MKDNTVEAVRLAALGWRVIPLHSPQGDGCDCNVAACASPAKHPRGVKGWADWQENPTPEQVAVWWGQWPHANVGVVVGPPSGVLVLDCDPRNDGYESAIRLTQEHGLLPPGPRAKTGGGGWHYYFQHPGGVVGNSTEQMAPGLDVKAERGYVVAPPSVHYTGPSYEWEVAPWDIALPVLPA